MSALVNLYKIMRRALTDVLRPHMIFMRALVSGLRPPASSPQPQLLYVSPVPGGRGGTPPPPPRLTTVPPVPAQRNITNINAIFEWLW